MDGGTSSDSYVTLVPPAFEEIVIHLDDQFYSGKKNRIKRKGAWKEM